MPFQHGFILSAREQTLLAWMYGGPHSDFFPINKDLDPDIQMLPVKSEKDTETEIVPKMSQAPW